MAEENQVEPQQITKEPQQVTKEPQRVMKTTTSNYKEPKESRSW